MEREYFPHWDDESYAILNRLAGDFLRLHAELLTNESIDIAWSPIGGMVTLDNVGRVLKGLSKIHSSKNIHKYNAIRSSFDQVVKEAQAEAKNAQNQS